MRIILRACYAYMLYIMRARVNREPNLFTKKLPSQPIFIIVLYLKQSLTFDKNNIGSYILFIDMGEKIMNPKIFGWQHLVYLAVFIVVAVAGLILAKKYAKTEKAQQIILKCLGILLLGTIIFNRFTIVFRYGETRWLALIPDSLCGMTSLVTSLAVLFGKKDNKVYHFIWHLGLVGGGVTSIAPGFIGQDASFLYLPTISGLLHHTLTVIVVVALLLFNQIHITYKKWHYSVLGLCFYLAFGSFLLTFLNYNDAFNMRGPLVANLTLWHLLPVYIVGYALILLTIELVRKYKAKKQS